MSMHNHDKKLNWKYYIEYLHAKLSNSEICNFQTECWFEAAKQRVNQSIANFKQYFIRLYADLNYHIFNKTCMMYLQMKINKIIMNKFLHISYIFINYVNLLKHFINIDLHCWSYICSKVKVQHLRRIFNSCMRRWSLLKFSASSTQFKDNVILKFNEFK